jgi:hypothetical protein
MDSFWGSNHAPSRGLLVNRYTLLVTRYWLMAKFQLTIKGKIVKQSFLPFTQDSSIPKFHRSITPIIQMTRSSLRGLRGIMSLNLVKFLTSGITRVTLTL